LPSLFAGKRESLGAIFKHKAKTTDEGDLSNSALLSSVRVSRAKAMMTPFVMRRKKYQVLKDLPKKSNVVMYCDMNSAQKDIYSNLLASARNAIEARAEGRKLAKKEQQSANVLMQLRKAAIHPMLFRRLYTSEMLKSMTKDVMKDERHCKANAEYVLQDMEYMSDFELHKLALDIPCAHRWAMSNDQWMESGKVDRLASVLTQMKAKGDRVLLFSQFTMVLDILESVLSTLSLTYLRMDGSTKVDTRQDMIDQFYDEQDITVFLLSTKAGGFGINLACANKVIIFDGSFNPHDDRQAEDRAHRVGQSREVEVVRLVTKGTIEEQILSLANTKLALDHSVSGLDDSVAQEQGQQLVASMLLRHSPTHEDHVDPNETNHESV